MKKLLAVLGAALLVLSTPLEANVTVDPTLEPNVTINCAMPVEREDGTPLALNEIAEVRFYSGTQSGVYTNTQNSSVCQLVVDATVLADGAYYYVVTAVDTDARESGYSVEKVVTVKRVKPPKSPTWLSVVFSVIYSLG